MAEHKNDEEQEPIRVNTREEFEDALEELFETGRPIEGTDTIRAVVHAKGVAS